MTINVQLLQVLNPLSGLYIDQNKTIQYYTTAFITVSCKMQFKMYPMDEQICNFHISSSKYTKDYITFNSSFEFDPESSQSQDFEITVKDIPEVKNNQTFVFS